MLSQLKFTSNPIWTKIPSNGANKRCEIFMEFSIASHRLCNTRVVHFVWHYGDFGQLLAAHAEIHFTLEMRVEMAVHKRTMWQVHISKAMKTSYGLYHLLCKGPALIIIIPRWIWRGVLCWITSKRNVIIKSEKATQFIMKEFTAGKMKTSTI